MEGLENEPRLTRYIYSHRSFIGFDLETMNFTNKWFNQTAKDTWDQLIPLIKPKKILEIGSYEGASICYLIEKLGSVNETLEIHAIDTWLGGHDHSDIDMEAVEARFDSNIAKARDGKAVELYKHKGLSDFKMANLLINFGLRDYFDFIYIDGSHETQDVLSDAVLAFKLLKPLGVMAFDDYLWFEKSTDGGIRNSPKLAIDAFININLSKLDIISAPNSQIYIAKKSAT